MHDASRGSFGRPDPLGAAALAPIGSCEELVTELRRCAEPGDDGARALELVTRRIVKARERGVPLPLADAFDRWRLAAVDRRILSALVVAAHEGRALALDELGAIVGPAIATARLAAAMPLVQLALVTSWDVDGDTRWRPVPRVRALAAGLLGLAPDVVAELADGTDVAVDDDVSLMADASRGGAIAQSLVNIEGLEREQDIVDRVVRGLARLGRRALVIDGRVAQPIGPLAREALLHDAVPIVRGEARVAHELAARMAPVFVVGGEPSMAAARVTLPPLTRAQRAREWAAAIGAPFELPTRAAAARLGPSTIRAVVAGARRTGALDGEAISRTLAALWPTPPSVRVVERVERWADLLVPDAVGELLIELLANARTGAGFIGHFAGSAGTGKTLTSALVARELGLPLWEASARALLAAPPPPALLRFIDEGAAVLSLTDAEAIALPAGGPNALALARWLEQTPGIVLLHGGERARLDGIVAARVALTIALLPPDAATRARLWQQALPELGATGSQLARRSSTGGQIDRWAAYARRLAALEGVALTMAHVERAIARTTGERYGE